jgi:hypothetical protein
MGKRQQSDALAQEVDELERQLDLVADQAEELVRLLALEGPERKGIGEVYKQARSDLKAPALGVEQMRDAYRPYVAGKNREVVLRGGMCSGLVAMQVAALDLTLKALSVAAVATGDDLEYVQEALSASWSVYQTHASMIASVLRAPGSQLTMISNAYVSDSSGAFAAFNEMLNEFPAQRARILEDAGEPS